MPVQVDRGDLYTKLITFYSSNPAAERRLFDLLETRVTSMRLIEHFVKKYAKPNAVTVPVRESVRTPEGTTMVVRQMNVHASYECHRTMFTKQYFDCCARGTRIQYKATTMPGKNVITTLGQLNFIRWLILFNVIKFVLDNIDPIRVHMQTAIVDPLMKTPRLAR